MIYPDGMKRSLAIAAILVSLSVTTSCKFSNCAALNATHPHGIGRPGAVDKVAGGAQRVTNFTVDAAQYNENASKLDRDRDGIACEKL